MRATSEAATRSGDAVPPQPPSRRPRMVAERIAGWAMTHRETAVFGWLGLVLLALVASMVVTGSDAPNYSPGGAGRAERQLNSQDGEYLPYHENVLIQAYEPGPSFADSPALRAAAQDLVAELGRHPEAVGDVRSPLSPSGRGYVSADGRSGLVSFTVLWPLEEFDAHMATATAAVGAVAARHPQVRVVQAGDRSLTAAVDSAVKDDLGRSHLLALPFVLIILIVVFGSLVAASLPVLLTLTGVVAALSLVMVIAKVVPVNSAASALILLIGVAVGVDYSLFYLRRYREERRAGRDDDTALRITARTSGHVVLISGGTVILCLTGLLFTGLGVFVGGTVALALVVGIAMIGSVTVLPAVLAWLRHRVDKGRVPWFGRGRTAARESRLWSAVAHRVSRRPVLWGGLATLALIVVALPAFHMNLQDAAAIDSLPRSKPAVDAAVRMNEAFPGTPVPAQVVVWREDGTPADTPQVRQAVDGLRRQIAASDGLLAEPVTVDRVRDIVVVRVPVAGSSTDERSARALRYLRDTAIPATFGALPGVDADVAGKTAQVEDFNAQLRDNTGLVFAFVLVLAFVLLVLAFKSPALALVSILLNVLSIAAAYGVLTWVFQDGNLSSALGFTPYGGVISWLPLFMFVVVFGLSMDYHIFILSRIRERWLAGSSPREATVEGLGHSAGVVSSAAVIMVAVFCVFITLTSIENKMIGLGLAVAILLDATVIRGVLVPAALTLLGDRAWRVPGWLRWLPGESPEPQPAAGRDRVAAV